MELDIDRADDRAAALLGGADFAVGGIDQPLPLVVVIELVDQLADVSASVMG